MNLRTTGNIGEDKKTSVKVHNPPGGQSNISFGNPMVNNNYQNNNNSKPTYKYNQHHSTTNNINPNENEDKKIDNEKKVKTSVKVHNPPGGRSQIQFG